MKNNNKFATRIFNLIDWYIEIADENGRDEVERVLRPIATDLYNDSVDFSKCATAVDVADIIIEKLAIAIELVMDRYQKSEIDYNVAVNALNDLYTLKHQILDYGYAHFAEKDND